MVNKRCRTTAHSRQRGAWAWVSSKVTGSALSKSPEELPVQAEVALAADEIALVVKEPLGMGQRTRASCPRVLRE